MAAGDSQSLNQKVAQLGGCVKSRNPQAYAGLEQSKSRPRASGRILGAFRGKKATIIVMKRTLEQTGILQETPEN